MAYRNYSPQNGFLVDQAGNGDFLTLEAALAVATSGKTIYLNPGTYSLAGGVATLKNHVNISSLSGIAGYPELQNANVTIVGKLIDNGVAVTANIFGVALQTNSDYVLSLTAASSVNLICCTVEGTNNTLFNMTNASANINVFDSGTNLGAQSLALVSMTNGVLRFYNTFCNNTGTTNSTATTISDGRIVFVNSQCACNLATSSTGGISADNSTFNTATNNQTAISLVGTGSSNFTSCKLASGSAVCVNIDTGTTCAMIDCNLNSSNTNVINGGGTLNAGPLYFGGSSSGINVTTKTYQAFGETGTWTPTVDGSVSGTTTYTSQNGYFTRIGNLVFAQAQITWSAMTGTANMTIGGLPFTIKNNTNGYVPGSVILEGAGFTYPVGATQLVLNGRINTTTCLIEGIGSAFGGNMLQMANAAGTIYLAFTYQV